MFDFITNAEPLLKTFWYVAIFSSTIFVIQSIMTFIGSADMDGIDADFDGNLDDASAPFQLFSLRNFVNFLLGFGWTGVTFYSKIENQTFLIILATAVGIVFVILFFILIKQILKLTEDNTFNINELVGSIGQVYIPIPANLSGKGKVQISAKGAHHELDAMTESDEKLPSSTMVKVERVNENILIVKKINE